MLSYVVPELTSHREVSATCSRFRDAALQPGAFAGAVVELPRALLDHLTATDAILALASKHLRLARELRLPAHASRAAHQRLLSEELPSLHVSVQGEGPVLLFAMFARLEVQTTMGLHFFEPRYRWMCRRVLLEAPPGTRPVFGFVNQGSLAPGSKGMLCEILEHTHNEDGTFDTLVKAQAHFTLLECWPEKVPNCPRAPALPVGYVEVHEEGKPRQPPSTVVPRRPATLGPWQRMQNCVPKPFRLPLGAILVVLASVWARVSMRWCLAGEAGAR